MEDQVACIFMALWEQLQVENFSVINASFAIAILTAIVYYEGWLFLWLLRRCYSAHVFSGISIPREFYLVLGAYAFNWYPFWAIFVIVGAFAILLADYAAFWFYTAVSLPFVLMLVTKIRARNMFREVEKKGFNKFHPQVKRLVLVGDQSSDMQELKYRIERNNFLMLERDSDRIVIFKPHSESEIQKTTNEIEVIEIPVSKIGALEMRGPPHLIDQTVWQLMWGSVCGRV